MLHVAIQEKPPHWSTYYLHEVHRGTDGIYLDKFTREWFATLAKNGATYIITLDAVPRLCKLSDLRASNLNPTDGFLPFA